MKQEKNILDSVGFSINFCRIVYENFLGRERKCAWVSLMLIEIRKIMWIGKVNWIKYWRLIIVELTLDVWGRVGWSLFSRNWILREFFFDVELCRSRMLFYKQIIKEKFKLCLFRQLICRFSHPFKSWIFQSNWREILFILIEPLFHVLYFNLIV